jgi:hypothetical protein
VPIAWRLLTDEGHSLEQLYFLVSEGITFASVDALTDRRTLPHTPFKRKLRVWYCEVGMLQTRLSSALLVVAACATAALAGSTATTATATAVVAALVTVGVTWWLVARFGTGCLMGLLALGGLDALPGPNLEARLVNSITAQDVVTALLVSLLLYQNAQAGFRDLRFTRQGRLLSCWGVAFLLWYGSTLIRTSLTTPVPLIHAITFSRAFAYFPILLPLLYGALRDRQRRDTMLLTLAVGAIVAALAQSASVAGHISLPFLVHLDNAGVSDGLTRLYTTASDIPFAALPLGYGLVLYGPTGRRRLLGSVLAVTGLLAVVLGLTRAMYLGEIVGLGGATAIALGRSDVRASVGRKWFLRSSVAMLIGVFVLYAYVPSNVTSYTVKGVGQRAGSLVADLGSGNTDKSLQTRTIDIDTIEYALRGHWLVGLGELDPTYAYVGGVPSGNIDDVDVSLLGGIALIGLIGIAIYAVPLFALVLQLIRERWRVRPPDSEEWLAFGGLAWCLGAIVVSPTLGLFFNPAQAVGSAIMLALVACWLADVRAERASALDGLV